MNRSLSSKMNSTWVPRYSDRSEEDLYREINSGQWDFVVNDYEKNFRWVHSAGLIKMLGGTALHLAVSDGVENIVEKLVTIICEKDEQKKVLKIKNKQGNTPLHVAASTGSLRMCICIAKANLSLGNERNKEGESPLFLAALLGRRDIFLCLRHICESKLDNSYCRRNGGETILHCAIKRECWDLAYQILHQELRLATFMDEKGISPLHHLADKPSAFKSGSRLGWWSSIIYYCIAVDVPKRIDPRRLIKQFTEEGKKHKFIQSLLTMIRVGKKADEENPEGSNVSPKSGHEGEECNCDYNDLILLCEGSLAESEDHKHYSFWKYCSAPFMIIIFVSNAILRILGFGEIKKIKETHMLSDLIMKTVIISTIHGQYYTGTNPFLTEDKDEFVNIEDDDMEDRSISVPPEYIRKHIQSQVMVETPILYAARNGILEMIEGILDFFPKAIHDETHDGKNIVLLAAEYRQSQVYELFRKRNLRKESMFHKLDKNGNSALHLAAALRGQEHGLIHGAALQMQWEIKWYEYVKNSMPPGFFHLSNNDGKTPKEIFTDTHKILVIDGGEWLTSMSNAGMVVAGIFVTVTLTISTTVLDRTKEGNRHGKPSKLFAGSSFVSFCTSLLAVVMFLSIATSGYRRRDFHNSLLGKLLVGLTALYACLVSTLISFATGFFFIFRDQLQTAASSKVLACLLLIIFFSLTQFSLYFHLVWATFKKVPKHITE